MSVVFLAARTSQVRQHIFYLFRPVQRYFFSNILIKTNKNRDKYQELWAEDLDWLSKMPKSKEIVSSSEGSSSEDEKPKKKQKMEGKKSKRERSVSSDDEPKKKQTSSKKPTAKAEEEEPSWDLGNKKLIKVRQFKGKALIDIREYYEDGTTGELKPGRKGIALNPSQFQKLKKCIDEVQQAVTEIA